MKKLAYISFALLFFAYASPVVKLIKSCGLNLITISLGAICLIPVFMAIPFIKSLHNQKK